MSTGFILYRRNMSSTNRSMSTFGQNTLTKTTLNYNPSQAPIPEPRKNVNHLLTSTKPETSLMNKQELDNQHAAKLVSVRRHTEHTPESICRESQKRTSFNEVVSDEGVGSPINVDYDEEENVDEYYEDDEECETPEQADELTNLSRQSMMPLHELIAYYQYIQHGQNQLHEESVNRPVKVQDSLDGKCAGNFVISDDVYGTEHQDLDANDEPIVNKIQLPIVQVENVDSDRPINDILPPIKDKRRIRANVVLELINSERDFVKHLKDVVDGYLYPARRHPEIFTGERISTIFSNVEQLYDFQKRFLERLESCINWEDLAASEVGNCFLEFEDGFSVYHYYCNNHPNATSELQDLYTKPRFVKFFEACRVLQNMIDISLDGFLLTPIQKICKYPLQLNELLKYTDKDHPDFGPIANALESMRNCANLANERKRRIEALADIMSFQEKVENWYGPKLCETSSILIHSSEVYKVNSSTWSQGVQLYLFDHLLLYSKRDLLKRNSHILKGRISMDSVTEISNADEYKSKKSFKLYCSEQRKWFVFTTRSEKEKDEWIRAFERERNLVESDENEGFHITDREIGVARRLLQNRKHSRSVRYRHKRSDTAVVDHLDIDDANTIMNRTLSLPSCIHPSHVMNFVEDSRVITTRKNSSPNSSSRSPVSSSQYLDEQENQQQSSGGWFKKMGSKKLARSQVYNVNGAGSSSAKSHANVQPVVAVDSTASTTKYDQLEKRHRDHMVSEEQARLFRLNNDLPPPSFMVTRSSIGSQISRQSGANSQQSYQRHSMKNHLFDQNPLELNLDSMDLSQEQCSSNQTGSSLVDDKSTFETTVVLSSGKVVRVREDAV